METKQHRAKYDPAITLLGIYPKKKISLSWKDICIPVFIASLFSIAKTWKQPKRVHWWMNGQRKCVLYTYIYTQAHTHTHTHTYTYNGIIFRHKKGNPAICKNMDGPWKHYAK